MNLKQSCMASVLFISVLCGCGGGGGSTNSSQAPTSSDMLDAHTSYTPVAPSVGDYYTFKSTYTDTSPGTTATPTESSYLDSIYTAVNADGSSMKTSVASLEDDNPDVASFDANRRILAHSSQPAPPGSGLTISNPNCTFSPAWATIPNTLSVGLSWNNSTTRTCGSNISQITSQGNVLGIESMTVAAGTFNTMKLAYTYTLTYDLGTTVQAVTCWREIKLGVNVKCTGTETFTPASAGSSVRSWTFSQELVGYANAKINLQKLAVERFAGTWAGNYTGTSTGACKIQVAPSGVLSGTCDTFAVSGNIDAQGNLSFNLSANGVSGPTFKATSMSALTWSGTWSAGNGASGSWNLSHY